MTPEQITLVRQSTAAFAAAGPSGVGAFYDRLFALDPTVRRLFPADLADQHQKFLATLVAVADALGDLDTLTADVVGLGARHHGYGVEAAHYPTVRTALLAALAGALGEGFTPAHEDAWRSGYDLVAELMQQAPRTP